MTSLGRGLLAFAMFVGIAVPASADPNIECSVQTRSQVELNNCLVKVETNVDAALAIVLGFAMEAAKALDDITAPRRDAVPALTVGQDAWVHYRDKHCAYVRASYGGGSGEGIGEISCRIDLARMRARELMEMLPEGSPAN